MNDLRQAAQQAADAWFRPHGINYVDFKPYMEALKQALAEPEQKPVAWMDREGDVYKELPSPHWCPPHTPLYAHPRTSRKPLTDWEMLDIYKKWNATPGVSVADFARAIERAHGIGEQHA